jgi:adenosylcobinamide amidohydrolase
MFRVRRERESLILSFPQPANTLSWAVLNGGFCHADHIINHHVKKADTANFLNNAQDWLLNRVACLGLEGTVVGMATAVEMRFLAQSHFSDGNGVEVTCFATVGHGNALTAGDRASFTDGVRHTINLIVLVRPGLREETMVEAVQIATEGRVRALYEAGVLSRQSGLPATGTGTDCIAIASLGEDRLRYCGKHTSLGEMIGLAAYTAVKTGVEKGRTGANP